MVVAEKEMTVHQTVKVLVPFFFDCLHYWEACGKEHQEAVNLALIDMENIHNDPFSPSGQPLHDMAKQCVIEFFRENN